MFTALTKLGRRESALLVIAATVIIGLGYLRWRYLQAQRAIREAIKSSGVELEQVRPDTFRAWTARTNAELTRLEEALVGEQETLTQLEQRFAPSQSNEALQALKVEVSDLAKSSGVLIRESVPYQPAAATAGSDRALLSQFATGTLYRRPLQRMRMESSFAGFRQFLRGLDRLSWRATVARFDIEAVPQPGLRNAPQVLDMTAILAL